MSARRFHPGLLEDAARDLDRQLRALSTGESRRPAYLKDHASHLDYLRTIVAGGVTLQGRFTFFKRVVRRVLRAYLFHQARVDGMVIERLTDLTDEIAQLRSALEGVRDEVREELDYQEIRLRSHARHAPTGPRIAPRNPVAVPDGARLLLGRVPWPRPGYVWISPHDARADVAAALDEIPARLGSAAEILAANVLEEHSVAEVRDVLLPHWAGLLRPGGTLTLVADDFEAAVDRLRDGSIDTHALIDSLFGDGSEPRRSAYTPETLRTIVSEAGFVEVTVSDRVQRPAANAYGFELTARSPAA
ncbi:MAG: hypothetical protein AB7I30_09980 [Isosphaeraceae bacterium]